MERRALIICMTNSPSGNLAETSLDYSNLNNFLTSNLGGNWHDQEIFRLENPTVKQLKASIMNMAYCDYAFVVFSGHGELEEETNLQYIELMDEGVSIRELYVTCKRQTIIIDACRGLFSMRRQLMEKSMFFSSGMESVYQKISTRQLFEEKLRETEEGRTILYAANKNQSALLSETGSAYISSLIGAAKKWEKTSFNEEFLNMKKAHEKAIDYMQDNFDTPQIPVMNREKRLRYYPFAVKFS